jgi:hypothetical protein
MAQTPKTPASARSGAGIQPVLDAARRRDIRQLESLVAQQLRSAPDPLKPYATALANQLIALGPRWNLAEALLPRRANWLRTSGWVRSVAEQRPVDGDGAPLPWWTYPAIDWIAARVRPEWRVFEWGSGHSTLWWSSRVARVLAVEHDPAWVAKIRPRLPDTAAVNAHEEQQAYVGALAAAGGVWDVIVIDGRWRDLCAREVQGHLADDGLVLLDNSDVETFAEAIQTLEQAGFHRIDFYGLIPSYCYKNCTSAFFRDPAILNRSARPTAHVSQVGPTVKQGMNGW